MYSFEFKSKLRKLNPDLYIDESVKVHQGGEYYSSNVMQRKTQREDKKSDYNYLSTDAGKLLSDIESGHKDTFVAAVPTNWVPEYDVFHLETGKLLAMGYRTILMSLSRKGVIDWSKACRIFGFSPSFYEHLNGAEKLAFCRKRLGYQAPSTDYYELAKKHILGY